MASGLGLCAPSGLSRCVGGDFRGYPPVMAGGCGLEVRATPAGAVKVRALPTCTAGGGGVIGPRAHGKVVEIRDCRGGGGGG